MSKWQHSGGGKSTILSNPEPCNSIQNGAMPSMSCFILPDLRWVTSSIPAQYLVRTMRSSSQFMTYCLPAGSLQSCT